ncbi:MAG: hypothetical protein ACFFFT_00680 [Candidatus Thorarchaeota archaeon]
MNIKIKKKEILAIGMFSLALSLFLNIFAGVIPIVNFLHGLSTGLSITMNIGF